MPGLPSPPAVIAVGQTKLAFNFKLAQLGILPNPSSPTAFLGTYFQLYLGLQVFSTEYQYFIASPDVVEPLWRNGLARCFPVLNTIIGRGCGFESRQWFINYFFYLSSIGDGVPFLEVVCIASSIH
jgi:hypothetical protein